MHFEYRHELFLRDCQAEAGGVSAQPSAASMQRSELKDPLAVARTPRRFAWLDNALALDTGTRDLQQCADAVMRLRAEYLFASQRSDEICFHSASGDALAYADYRRGQRPPPGRAKPWSLEAQSDASWRGFRRYMNLVFGIANTASLRRELTPVADPRTITAGDVYIEAATANRYGHAVIVLDVAENSAAERVFLIAQSYMPAQDMHVLRNLDEPALGAWYRPQLDGSLDTPEWSFPAHSLRRFAASCASQRISTALGEGS